MFYLYYDAPAAPRWLTGSNLFHRDTHAIKRIGVSHARRQRLISWLSVLYWRSIYHHAFRQPRWCSISKQTIYTALSWPPHASITGHTGKSIELYLVIFYATWSYVRRRKWASHIKRVVGFTYMLKARFIDWDIDIYRDESPMRVVPHSRASRLSQRAIANAGEELVLPKAGKMMI